MLDAVLMNCLYRALVYSRSSGMSSTHSQQHRWERAPHDQPGLPEGRG
eukprot:CAMPEP_0177509992 /NCGR_PEP_ID=MMETSP0369-20130122/41862_1 /TAXON_ID=447022 ORGANISM="Scrippsiella hangoei-like, Strain SHHI-4" /NCGR_SAMPLE_ID=MMETSP0369 /ASSEMBLY_ACC=CAM_ASM_000364 /LENGTH=47 /DNA_ID= /DNA_START= /DNA_END= /DNA_ORIENTATION=